MWSFVLCFNFHGVNVAKCSLKRDDKAEGSLKTLFCCDNESMRGGKEHVIGNQRIEFQSHCYSHPPLPPLPATGCTNPHCEKTSTLCSTLKVQRENAQNTLHFNNTHAPLFAIYDVMLTQINITYQFDLLKLLF